MNLRIPWLLACCASFAFAASYALAQTPREVRGSADAYGESGVALAWSVLRGGDDASTYVVVRVAADPKVYPWFGVAGSNPFSHRQLQILREMETPGTIDLRLPRAQFADFPRTEWRLYKMEPGMPGAVPALVVFYLGIPDKTPEFTSEAKLDAYLAERLDAVRSGAR
jgi:hypothetical protein